MYCITAIKAQGDVLYSIRQLRVFMNRKALGPELFLQSPDGISGEIIPSLEVEMEKFYLKSRRSFQALNLTGITGSVQKFILEGYTAWYLVFLVRQAEAVIDMVLRRDTYQFLYILSYNAGLYLRRDQYSVTLKQDDYDISKGNFKRVDLLNKLLFREPGICQLLCLSLPPDEGLYLEECNHQAVEDFVTTLMSYDSGKYGLQA